MPKDNLDLDNLKNKEAEKEAEVKKENETTPVAPVATSPKPDFKEAEKEVIEEVKLYEAPRPDVAEVTKEVSDKLDTNKSFYYKTVAGNKLLRVDPWGNPV